MVLLESQKKALLLFFSYIYKGMDDVWYNVKDKSPHRLGAAVAAAGLQVTKRRKEEKAWAEFLE